MFFSFLSTAIQSYNYVLQFMILAHRVFKILIFSNLVSLYFLSNPILPGSIFTYHEATESNNIVLIACFQEKHIKRNKRKTPSTHYENGNKWQQANNRDYLQSTKVKMALHRVRRCYYDAYLAIHVPMIIILFHLLPLPVPTLLLVWCFLPHFLVSLQSIRSINDNNIIPSTSQPWIPPWNHWWNELWLLVQPVRQQQQQLIILLLWCFLLRFHLLPVVVVVEYQYSNRNIMNNDKDVLLLLHSTIHNPQHQLL